MIALDLISYEIPSLKPNETGLKAMSWMEEFKITELPVVDQTTYLGLISETAILDGDLIEGELKEMKTHFLPFFISQDEHIFEVIRIMAENDLSILPVLGDNKRYMGSVYIDDLAHYIAESQSLYSPGGIIQLEMNIQDYSLTEIARLIEADDAKILNLYISTHPDSKKMEITIKVNKVDLTRILQTFNRFNYIVSASFHQSSFQEDLNDRYESFMRYLNM